MGNDHLTRKQDDERTALFHALSAHMSGRARQNLADILGPKEGWKDGWQSGDFHRRPGCSNGPDFYRIFSDRIVGIEHFVVEKGVMYSDTKKGGKYQNYWTKLKRGIEKAGRNAAATMSDDDLREAGIVVHKAVWDNAFEGSAIEDSNMWSSLENSIGKHAGQLADYRANLRGLDDSKRIEIGLLVEISGDFSDLLLFDNGRVTPNKDGLLPLSDGLFERLFKALDGKPDDRFDFVVLYRWGLRFSDDAVGMTSVMTCPVDASRLRPYFQAELVYYYIPAFLARVYKSNTTHEVSAEYLDQAVEGCVTVYADWYFALVRRVFKWWSGDRPFCCNLELAAMAYALMQVGAKWFSFGVREFENGAVLEEAYPLVNDWDAVYQHMARFSKPFRDQGPLPLFLMVSVDEYKKLGRDISERLKMRVPAHLS